MAHRYLAIPTAETTVLIDGPDPKAHLQPDKSFFQAGMHAEFAQSRLEYESTYCTTI
jgi:hypothetical protein